MQHSEDRQANFRMVSRSFLEIMQYSEAQQLRRYFAGIESSEITAISDDSIPRWHTFARRYLQEYSRAQRLDTKTVCEVEKLSEALLKKLVSPKNNKLKLDIHDIIHKVKSTRILVVQAS